VVLRLGRLIPEAKSAGINLVFWPIETLYRINMRIETLDVPPQDIITRDNVSVESERRLLFPRGRRQPGPFPSAKLHLRNFAARADYHPQASSDNSNSMKSFRSATRSTPSSRSFSTPTLNRGA